MIDSAFYFMSFSFQDIFNAIWRSFRKNPKRYCVVLFKKQVFISNRIQNIFFTICHFPILSFLLIYN